MMPRVAACIMWRSGQHTLRIRRLPVCLAFEVYAMTRGAVMRVERASRRYIPVFQFMIRTGGSGQGKQRRRKPFHTTLTHVRIPPTAWLSM